MMVIKFAKGGKVVMTPSGYPGAACTRMTAHYLKNMAVKIVKDTPTEEMAMPEQVLQSGEKNQEAQ